MHLLVKIRVRIYVVVKSTPNVINAIEQVFHAIVAIAILFCWCVVVYCWQSCQSLNPYLNSAILNFHTEIFHRHVKSMKTAKLFYLKTFMIYGIYSHTNYTVKMGSSMSPYKGSLIYTQLATCNTYREFCYTLSIHRVNFITLREFWIIKNVNPQWKLSQ